MPTQLRLRAQPDRSLSPPFAIVAVCILLALVTILVVAGERQSGEMSQVTPIESALASL
jgi:hypothetical protein